MLHKWQTLLAIIVVLGGAAVWAADQRWATKVEAKASQSDHAAVHQGEAAARAQMMKQLEETRGEMKALREDLAFLRCFLDPRADWDAFKQRCVERPHSSLPTTTGRVPPVPPGPTVSTSSPHSPAPPTSETTTPP